MIDAKLTFSTHLKTCLLMSAVTFAFAHTSFAQEQPADLKAVADGLPPEVKRQIAQRPDAFLKSIANTIFSISPLGIVTTEALDVHQHRSIAARRANEIEKLLRDDLDGDGTISAAEIELQMPYLNASQKAQLTLSVLENDENDDGALSPSEIFATAEKAIEGNRRGGNRQADQIMAFDVNADGAVDLSEVSRVVAALHLEEAAKLRSTRKEVQDPMDLCKVPHPKGADVVFLSGYTGAAMSTLAVSGQVSVTSVATVRIEEGFRPLYIFATAFEPVIWRFEGATERVQDLVVQSGNSIGGSGTAAMGIDTSKITFVPQRACIDGHEHEVTTKSRANINSLGRAIGKSVEFLALSYTIDRLRIPNSENQAVSGDTLEVYRTPLSFSLNERTFEISARGMTMEGALPADTTQKTTDRKTIRELMRFYPGG